MTTTKETFHEVTAELVTDEHGTAVILTQPDQGTDDPCTVLMHPLQLRHFAERYAGMESADWMTTRPVKTLTNRLRTLAFHIDSLYDYIKNHSDHKHADLSFELAKAVALTEMADAFCSDLPDENEPSNDMSEPEPEPSNIAEKSGQASLI